MSSISQHSEWLSLIDVSGPFLAEPVLKSAFPQGLEGVAPEKRKKLRQAYAEWRDSLDQLEAEFPQIHAAWIDLVLREGLELDEDRQGQIFKAKAELPETLNHSLPEHGVTLSPDFAVVNDQNSDEPLMLISVFDPDVSLITPIKGDGWAASPAERMVELCRVTDVRLGLLTNGEQWMFIDAPEGGVTTFATWEASLWSQEPKTLQAFVNLLGVRRFFVDSSEQLPSLLDESLKHQDDVTEALGEQVRRAVEVLIQSLDRANVDRNHELLEGVAPAELYEAALTVMMRIVFLLSAEERGLLHMGDERYEANYAVSTLRMQLRSESEEILERRWDAWSRLLSLFRAVYGGIDHEALRLPALGGSLFDPDRFPFLEGRLTGSNWKSDPATPLPIDNRTVMLLLDAVQLFQGRTLSYRALDVEQIGYVYEGLLERTVMRAKEVTLDLDATKSAKKPWVTLDELDAAAAKSSDAVSDLLIERTGSSASRVTNDLAKTVEEADADKLLAACHGDQPLRDRIKPYFHFLREDPWGYPLVYPVDTFMVTTGEDRRETGTHYTPKSLTEVIVKETLEPIAYVGPAEGMPRDGWVLKSPVELLDLKICDPAMGSGAFLVQVCRWLSDRLIEAWEQSEAAGYAVTSEGIVVEKVNGYEPLRDDSQERILTARRLIAERCLYGVDVNPLAVELAKLSIWLVTLAKGRPFGFLDHNLRSGDSLLGINDLEQLNFLDMNPGRGSSKKLFASKIDQVVQEAMSLRSDLRSRPIRDIRDVEVMASLDEKARQKLKLPELIADALVGELLDVSGKAVDTMALSIEAGGAVENEESKVEALKRRARKGLSNDLPVGGIPRRPFHWPLEFPEVFCRENSGFDTIVGNPPFIGNKFWKERLGSSFQHLAKVLLRATVGKIDLSVVFHRRAVDLLRQEGGYGLLATTNIAEGSSIPIGLGEIYKHGEFIFAIKSFKWPGKASVTAAVVCFYKGKHVGVKIADGTECEQIGARLEPEVAGGWEPMAVPDPVFSFEGVHNGKGLAFVLGPSHHWLERLRSERGSLLQPYISGNDITTHALLEVNRWALDIGDNSLDVIKEKWPVAYEFLMEVVEPTRTPTALKSYKGLIDRWWQFWNHRADLVRRLRQKEQCVVFSKITKHPICMIADSNWIYTNKVALIACDRPDMFAICLSSFFAEWIVARQGAKFGVGASLSLSIREAFATFPLPEDLVDERGIVAARQFDEIAKSWCQERTKGLTEFINALGDSSVTTPQILESRALLVTIDQMVAQAYGLEDVVEGRGYYQAPYIAGENNFAYIVSPESRTRILGHLTSLNRRQCEHQSPPTFAVGGRL